MLKNVMLELPLFLLTMAFGSSFWQFVKCAKFRNLVLCKSELLNAFIRHLEPAWIMNEGENMRPRFGSCRNEIILWLDIRTDLILARARSLVFVELIICALSYALNPDFVVLNLAAFCAVHSVQPPDSIKCELLFEVERVLLYLYKWNLDDPAGCSEAVSTNIPRLRTALVAIRKLNNNSYWMERNK